MPAGGAEFFSRGNTAIGGSNIVPKRRQNRRKIPPLMRVIVCYQYLVIHVFCSISSQYAASRPDSAQFCCAVLLQRALLQWALSADRYPPPLLLKCYCECKLLLPEHF
jgi:hypothetical protein